jgi:protein-disulfide isomerase
MNKLQKPATCLLAGLLLLGGAATGCTKESRSPVACPGAPTKASATAGAPPVLDPGAVVATIDGQAVTLRDVDSDIAPELRQLDHKFASDTFELRRQELDQMVVKRLVDAEAKKEGTTEDAWLKKHVEGSIPDVTEADAKKFYDENSARMGGRAFDQAKPQIIAFLTSQKRRDAAEKVFDALKSKAKVEILLEEPAVAVDAVGPSVGPANAPVTIVEFSDFQCPFCSKVEPTIKRVMTDYAGKVRFVFRDYPLPFHEHAEKASEASHCAQAQEKYWPMHDALFANQDKLDVAGLKKLAAGVSGLDQAKFDQCLDSGAMAQEVASNEKAGEAAGVSGTPRFFVNGHPLDGAQPYEEFKTAIDRELARARSESGPAGP